MIKIITKNIEKIAFNKKDWKVKLIDNKTSYEWLLYKHYAQKVPQLCYVFGLFKKDNMQGVITFGIPPNRYYNEGKCIFKSLKVNVLELNRLVVNDNLPKNTLSFFVSQALKKLSPPLCIVSYADSNWNHCGYIYQATNWIYTGKSIAQCVLVDKDGKEIHKKTVYQKYGINKTKEFLQFGFTKRKKLSKYRYLMFLGNKKQKKEMRKNLKWKILPYPKGDNKRYNTSYKIKNLNINKKGKIIITQ